MAIRGISQVLMGEVWTLLPPPFHLGGETCDVLLSSLEKSDDDLLNKTNSVHIWAHGEVHCDRRLLAPCNVTPHGPHLQLTTLDQRRSVQFSSVQFRGAKVQSRKGAKSEPQRFKVQSRKVQGSVPPAEPALEYDEERVVCLASIIWLLHVHLGDLHQAIGGPRLGVHLAIVLHGLRKQSSIQKGSNVLILDSRRVSRPAPEAGWGANHISDHDVWHQSENGERCYNVWFTSRELPRLLLALRAVLRVLAFAALLVAFVSLLGQRLLHAKVSLQLGTGGDVDPLKATHL